jgi:predicted transcriptional regulator
MSGGQLHHPKNSSIADKFWQEQLKRDTLDAWEEYQRTGLHCTGEEVSEWLRKLARGEDAPPPTPHK